MFWFNSWIFVLSFLWIPFQLLLSFAYNYKFLPMPDYYKSRFFFHCRNSATIYIPLYQSAVKNIGYNQKSDPSLYLTIEYIKIHLIWWSANRWSAPLGIFAMPFGILIVSIKCRFSYFCFWTADENNNTTVFSWHLITIWSKAETGQIWYGNQMWLNLNHLNSSRH